MNDDFETSLIENQLNYTVLSCIDLDQGLANRFGEEKVCRSY